MVEVIASTSKGVGGHQRPNRGATDTWLTPPQVISALGRFDLDPCAAPRPRPWETAEHTFTLPDEDGLAESWFGRVFLNPPYGPETGRWLERLADHGTGTALIFARTETEMFHRFVWERASALLFLEGRIHFHYPDGTRAKFNSGAPSVLVAYGSQDAQALVVAVSSGRLDGKVVPL